MMPSGIQRRAPLTPLPTCGISTSDQQQQRRRRRATAPTSPRSPSAPAPPPARRRTPMRDATSSVARQEVRRRVARELRVVGQRDRGRIDHHQAAARAARRRPRPAPGRSRAARAGWPAPTPRPVAHRHARRGRARAARAQRASQRVAAEACGAALMQRSPRARPRARCTVGDEHLGAVRVVAEHVEAGAGRAQQHRVAGCARCAKHQRVAASQRRRGAAAARRCRRAPLRSRRVAADQRHRARMARHRRGQRREVLALAVAAEDHDQLAPAPCRRPGRRARRPWRRRWCPCCRRRPRRSSTLRDELDAVRLAAVFAQAVQHRRRAGSRWRVASASAASALAALWRPRMRSASAGIRRCRWISSARRSLRLLASRRPRSARTSQAMPFSTTRPKSPGRCGASRPKRTTLRGDRLLAPALGLAPARRGTIAIDQRVVAVDHHHRAALPKMRALAAA